ncbi:MAG: HAMP domain-containing protein, partial [Clostridiales Family XIII bacterium]|nr:HAMP domain-containing protein [Clostridiales Family XIII bacterium]
MVEILRSLRTQLSVSLLLTLLVTIALTGVFGGLFVNRAFEQYVARQEEIRSENIVSDLENRYHKTTRAWDKDFLHTVGMYSLYDGYILKVYDADGSAVWDAENHDMSLCNQIMDDISKRMESVKNTGGFAAHIYDINSEGRRIGSVSITYYGPYFFSENDFRFISALNNVLMVAGILAALFSIVVGGLLARRIARPVIKTAHIAGQISRGNYDIRVESRTNTRELNDLVNAINHLAGALAGQENLRKRMTTDVAHELRTPLAAVGAHLEAMIGGLWEVTPERLKSCHNEIRRLGGLVADLERLAKIESGDLKLHKSQVDLLDVASIAIANLRAEAESKKQSLSLDGQATAVDADKDRMIQVVTNLLSNAIQYTPDGGHIRIEATAGAQNGIVRVCDDGIGIPEKELPFIFERFYRT